MVTIVNFEPRESREGEQFNALILQGDLETVISKETGKPYITARRASIPSTFDERMCQELIGRKLPGEIQRVDTDPYEYELENGEKIILEHSWEYQPEPVSEEDHVFETRPDGVAV